MPKGYIASETSVHFMNYHFVWCPKYRRKVLVGKIRKRFEELVKQKCQELDCEVIALAIGEDYTYLFVRANPKQAPNSIIGQVKGFTSRILRKEFKDLRSRLPTLWTRSYFVSTHGHISDKMIQKYIDEQKGV